MLTFEHFDENPLASKIINFPFAAKFPCLHVMEIGLVYSSQTVPRWIFLLFFPTVTCVVDKRLVVGWMGFSTFPLNFSVPDPHSIDFFWAFPHGRSCRRKHTSLV